jgi:hypothetical protein
LESFKLESTVATLRADVENITQKLLELDNDIQTAQQVQSEKGQEKADWEKTCGDNQRIYDRETENRSERLEIIKSVLQLFQTQFS